MIKEQITAEIKTAMKANAGGGQAGAALKLTVLRGLSSVINNKAIDKKAPLTDEEIQLALGTEAKRRKESATAFIAGGRQDLADNEMAELLIIQAYLPKQMTSDETEKAVSAILAKLDIKATANGGVPPDGGKFGPAMKAVMAELRGKADAGAITKIIKKKLG